MTSRDDDRRVCLGAFAGAHGVRGEAKVKTFTGAPEDIAAYGPVATETGAQFTLEIIRVLKPGLVLVRAPEIKSREEAEALAGLRLYVPRSALPATDEDEYYVDDLVGLAAFDETGAKAGVVVAAYNFGAGDLIELKDVPGRKGAVVITFTKEAVPAVDLAGGRLIVARAALADEPAQDEAEAPGPSLSDDTGEIVSDDISVDLDAMREEDA